MAFVLASCVLLVIPGPTILTIVSYSITHGRRANILLVATVALGTSTALVLSLAGLGALLATSARLFVLIKWAAGLYLIYLVIKLITSGAIRQTSERAKPFESQWKLFAKTWLVTALNPKGIVFFVAFLPQFIVPASPVAPQAWILSVSFVMLATLNATLYAVFVANARQLLASTKAQRRFTIGGGSLLTVAGAWSLTTKQAS